MAGKRWSKLKRDVESLFADSVKGRVALHATHYGPDRWLYDFREWIAIDGQEVMTTVPARRWLCAGGDRRELAQESFFEQGELVSAMHEYLSMSIGEIIRSENVIIRALGMLDGRLGKRRLRALDVSNEPKLVQLLYAFRCHAENIETTLSFEPRNVTPQLGPSPAQLRERRERHRKRPRRDLGVPRRHERCPI
ncbi:MAG: hypothetical protein FJ026_04235 [Chloroflexi bacterium]|nr:hypothetical protein [Chloroflexota bacterium]